MPPKQTYRFEESWLTKIWKTLFKEARKDHSMHTDLQKRLCCTQTNTSYTLKIALKL